MIDGGFALGLFGDKKQDVRLTEKQIKELTKGMSGRELREFNKAQKEYAKKQRQKEDDAFFDGLLWGSLFDDD